jgi:hypothetical protein
MICQWFCLKTTGTVFSGLASKPVATVFFDLVSKLVATASPGLASKPVVGFFIEPQNQGGEGFSGLGLKTVSYGLVIWASKSPRRFLGLGLKTMRATVCRLHHKTDGRCDGVGHSSRSSGSLHVDACQARVFQSGLNTGGGAMVGGAHVTITEVALSSS